MAKRFYDHATDTRQAIHGLLDMRDPVASLEASGYAEQFAASEDPRE